MSWVNAYVGVPQQDLGRDQDGCDCWGIVRLIYQRELNIELPSYCGTYVSPVEQTEIAALIDTAEATGPWHEVDRPGPFDLLLFRRGRFRTHIGIAIDHRMMLHMEDQARIVDTHQPRWMNRFCGAFRHVATGVKQA